MNFKRAMAAGLMSAFLLAGCGNADLVGTQYNFGYAMIRLPDGRIYQGKVDAWARSDDSDRVRVTIDGIDYVTQYSNVCLFSKKPEWIDR